MSDSRQVITPLWLFGSWRSFLYSPSVYFLNIFYFGYVHAISVLYCARFGMKCSLGISNFLEEISSLSHSIVFLYFFALIAEDAFLISPCYSLELWIKMDISFLFSFAFHFSSQLFARPHQTTILSFCISSFWVCFWSFPLVWCYKPPTIVLQALCLSDLIPWIYLSITLYNHKAFDLGHT